MFQVLEHVSGPTMYSGPASLSMEEDEVAFLHVLPGSSQSFDPTFWSSVAQPCAIAASSVDRGVAQFVLRSAPIVGNDRVR